MQDGARATLAAIENPGSFAVERSASSSALRLEVKGLGPVTFPISPTRTRELCSVALLARHGFKTETRLDRKVRDTWEIPKTKIKIDQKHWNVTLSTELERIREGLGLPEGSRLRSTSQAYEMPARAYRGSFGAAAWRAGVIATPSCDEFLRRPMTRTELKRAVEVRREPSWRGGRQAERWRRLRTAGPLQRGSSAPTRSPISLIAGAFHRTGAIEVWGRGFERHLANATTPRTVAQRRARMSPAPQISQVSTERPGTLRNSVPFR